MLEWVAISFSRGSSRLRDWTQVSRIVGGRFAVWATREAPLLAETCLKYGAEEDRPGPLPQWAHGKLGC